MRLGGEILQRFVVVGRDDNDIFLVVFHNMSTKQGKGEGLEKKTRNEEKRIIATARSFVVKEATASSSNNANSIRTSYLYILSPRSPRSVFLTLSCN